MYYMGFTYGEAYRLPIWQRRWFVDRLNREFEKAADNDTNVSRAAHHNDPASRAMAGRQRGESPARLRRFT
jgi:hypothetical protein